MASNGYPHMVFVQPDAGLDKETLAVFLEGLFPDADVTDKPLRVDMELGGYLFSFWLEEAEGVADHYATYLPEGARRRWLSRCESMIDLHGQPDPERAHAATAQRIVQALQEQDGIEVFSEETRRFLGMDYGDGTSSAPPPAPIPALPEPGSTPGSDAVPAPEEIPAAEFAPQSPEPVVLPTTPDETWTPEPWTPPVPTDAPMAAEPAPHVVEPAHPVADPAPSTAASGADPAAGPEAGPESGPESSPEPSPDEPTTVWMPTTPDPDRPVPPPDIDIPEAASPTLVPAPAAATPTSPAPPGPPVPPSTGPAPWQHPGSAQPPVSEDAEEKKGFFKRMFGRRPE